MKSIIRIWSRDCGEFCPCSAPICAVLNSALCEKMVVATYLSGALIGQNYWSIKRRKKANSICFVFFHYWVGWEGRSGKQRWFSLQSRLQTEEQHGGNVVPMCTIPLDVNGPYEYKVRLACSDYTWRAKLLLVMMMCICFSEGWIASNGFCFQFLCLMWGTSGSWVLV